MKEHVMSDEMKLFFGKLLDLKAYCNNKCDMSDYESEADIWRDVYRRLDAIIKEKK